MPQTKDSLITIKQEHYFPFNFKIFGLMLVFIVSLGFLNGNFHIVKGILLIFFSILAFIFFTTRYVLEINIRRKSYTIYTWFLGFKIGKPSHFNHIEKLYINEVSYATTAVRYSTGVTKNFKKKLFKAFMKLDDGTKIHMDTDSNHDKLQARVNEYRLRLKTEMN